ncbi:MULTISPECIES: DUF1513 domain-containing protein [unclassified Aureimonas]|uniref:DUF1513 domain-containing protein n=1 Tax=unclassified Aureimonas TaxID=2615206 RepID=UPI0006F6BC00|nr:MULTISPECIES: DUF1513 domain-containing protein [unclassified Aureimonas]KQT66208.1 hypothetical protein ASG62_19420 [Aureimonas sp. Leaf427]KQT72396.1 hypothetical protein ASG54_03790 [Aureimonas sp. Leaf460]
MHLVDRRAFLLGAGASFASALSPRAAEALARTDTVYGAACQVAEGRYGCAVFSERGEVLSLVELPDRGHDVTFDPVSGRAVAFARRPRNFAVVFDPASGRTLKTILSAKGRHFFGHGFFSPDGALLYATENEIETAEGLIGLYDTADDFRRIGEFRTGGMDPHEALLMPDGETIVVANGGIETDPTFGRQKLNIATMEPSLVFLDRRSGEIREQQRLDAKLHQLSIRHLAIDGRSRVWFGCQYEGNPADAPQLVGFASLGETPRLIELPRPELAALSNYVGSVAASADGARIALSSPVGNRLLVLDAATATVAAHHTLKDGCGLAPSGGDFLATSGQGDIVMLADDTQLMPSRKVLWDNHILALS